MDAVGRSRVVKALQNAGITQPESCPIVLKALEDVQSRDSKKRLIAIHMLGTCLEYLKDAGQAQLQMNLAVFLLERGVATGIAAAMRAVAAGEWVHNLWQKELFLGSKGKVKVTNNIAFTCGFCLGFLVADRRCVSAAMKDFPDLARVSKAIFKSRPSDSRIEDPAQFEKMVKWAILKVLVPVVSHSSSFKKLLAQDTSFMKDVLDYAEGLRVSDNAQGSAYLESLSLIYNVVDSMIQEDAVTPAFQVDIVRFFSTILANCMSRDVIMLATKLLGMLLTAPCCQPGLCGGSLSVAAEQCRLDSFLLAMLKVGHDLEESLQFFASEAANMIWKSEFKLLTGVEQVQAFLHARFQNDEQARSRATDLARIFSADAEGKQEFRSFVGRKKKYNIDLNDARAQIFQVKGRLECRKCSRMGCESLEVRAGTFQVCGRCKLAVYCSRACQKQAWKEGHRELCHRLPNSRMRPVFQTAAEFARQEGLLDSRQEKALIHQF